MKTSPEGWRRDRPEDLDNLGKSQKKDKFIPIEQVPDRRTPDHLLMANEEGLSTPDVELNPGSTSNENEYLHLVPDEKAVAKLHSEMAASGVTIEVAGGADKPRQYISKDDAPESHTTKRKRPKGAETIRKLEL